MLIQVCKVNELQNQKRALVKLISNSKYPNQLVIAPFRKDLYCMESICPHSGGPLHLGPIVQDIEDLQPHLICPWHAFRFSVIDGKSADDDIFETYVFKIHVEDDVVFLDYPDADATIESISIYEVPPEKEIFNPKAKVSENVKSKNDYTLVDWAIEILNTADPSEKVRLTFEASNKWFDGEISEIGFSNEVPDRPPRHEGLEVVDHRKTKKVGKGGSVQSRIAILHALANVEQWAIDLAWDIIARFANVSYETKNGTILLKDQREFFTDFVRVANEEAKHFSFLVERLKDLGAFYGQLPVHGGLWDSATLTAHSLLARLAIVHMVHEARGLDVNPNTIEKFRKAGDMESVEKLSIIHRDEITHVAAGQRWFSWVCAVTEEDRYERFHDIVKNLFFGPLRPPFNEEDRLIAGLDQKYYLPLAESK
ncbi:hypothetical protein BC833DRAFT_591782 [Globomyces pollinis-pini]|nr:hypothetical protein BC833DRAFT_591782 [Globomyces pollinis-pini]